MTMSCAIIANRTLKPVVLSTLCCRGASWSRAVAKKPVVACLRNSRRIGTLKESNTTTALPRSNGSAVSHSSPKKTTPVRQKATATSPSNTVTHDIDMPTTTQLTRHFFISAVPFVGFGFMDNTVMIHVGNEFDCTIGVILGLSTLAAAAIGQIVANGASVVFGGYVERLARSLGLPSAGFTSLQRQLPMVRRVALMGNLSGCLLGSTLGLLNLLLIDTGRSQELKLEALTEDQEFAFEVEASNKDRKDATTLTVRGPDVDGLLASMTAALTSNGCSLVELHASNRKDNDGTIEDVFVVRPRGHHHGQIEDDKLEELAQALLEASKDPLSAHTLKAQVKDLESTNEELLERIYRLEKLVEERQITVVRAHDN